LSAVAGPPYLKSRRSKFWSTHRWQNGLKCSDVALSSFLKDSERSIKTKKRTAYGEEHGRGDGSEKKHTGRGDEKEGKKEEHTEIAASSIDNGPLNDESGEQKN
jgi:hypothetical protein